MKLRAKSLGRISGPYYFLLFSPAEISFRLTWDFFSPGRNSARNPEKLHSGLNSSPCNGQFDFKRICFRSRAEILHIDNQALTQSLIKGKDFRENHNAVSLWSLVQCLSTNHFIAAFESHNQTFPNRNRLIFIDSIAIDESDKIDKIALCRRVGIDFYRLTDKVDIV